MLANPVGPASRDVITGITIGILSKATFRTTKVALITPVVSGLMPTTATRLRSPTGIDEDDGNSMTKRFVFNKIDREIPSRLRTCIQGLHYLPSAAHPRRLQIHLQISYGYDIISSDE